MRQSERKESRKGEREEESESKSESGEVRVGLGRLFLFYHLLLINPRRACTARVTVVVQCVSVCYHLSSHHAWFQPPTRHTKRFSVMAGTI